MKRTKISCHPTLRHTGGRLAGNQRGNSHRRVIDDKMISQPMGVQCKSDAPKGDGSWLRYKPFKDSVIGFFILFSSLGAILGQPGQGNYAQPMPSLMPGIYASGSWLTWFIYQLGCLERFSLPPPLAERVLEKLELQGLAAFSPEQGLQALEILFNDYTPCRCYADGYAFQSSALARRLWEILLQEQPPESAQTAAAGLSRISFRCWPSSSVYLQSYVQTVLVWCYVCPLKRLSLIPL
jgi:hypothetical protein